MYVENQQSDDIVFPIGTVEICRVLVSNGILASFMQGLSILMFITCISYGDTRKDLEPQAR